MHRQRDMGPGTDLRRRVMNNVRQTATTRPKRAPQIMETTSGQVFWLPDYSTNRAFPSLVLSGVCGVRPRLQRRDRDGFSPSSLFSGTGHKPVQAPKSDGDGTATTGEFN